MPEMITAAAIKYHMPNGVTRLATGRRHQEIDNEFLSACISHGWGRIQLREYGFLTTKGRFLNRIEAMTFAREHGQLKNTNVTRAELNSEDLW